MYYSVLLLHVLRIDGNPRMTRHSRKRFSSNTRGKLIKSLIELRKHLYNFKAPDSVQVRSNLQYVLSQNSKNIFLVINKQKS